MIDPGPRRAPANLGADPLDRLGVALHDQFHGSVRPIQHPPGNPFDCREFLHKPPEPYTLHSTRHHEPAGHKHPASIAGGQRRSPRGHTSIRPLQEGHNPERKRHPVTTPSRAGARQDAPVSAAKILNHLERAKPLMTVGHARQ